METINRRKLQLNKEHLKKTTNNIILNEKLSLLSRYQKHIQDVCPHYFHSPLYRGANQHNKARKEKKRVHWKVRHKTALFSDDMIVYKGDPIQPTI